MMSPEIRAKLEAILAPRGYALDDIQIHVTGERDNNEIKYVLTGKRVSDGLRVVIKASNHTDGMSEMRHERKTRAILDKIRFAVNVFRTPKQLDWFEADGFLIAITVFLKQEKSFLERPFTEQFFLAMKAFETQEGTHATTYEHANMVKNTFESYNADTYLRQFNRYHQDIKTALPDEHALDHLLSHAQVFLDEHRERLEQYNGFLTHWDFVPHNFRIIGRDVFVLDHASIRFGNKYESWARFLNFMLLYHPALEQALVTYVAQNRTPEESEALRLMRVYRLGELIWYYVKRLKASTGNLFLLDQARIVFWSDVLRSILDNIPLSDTRIEDYRNLRDRLRSDEEKKRQQGLH